MNASAQNPSSEKNSPPAKAKGGSRLRRWAKRLLQLAVVLVLLIALALIFAKQLFGPLIKGQIETVLRERIGGIWEVGAIDELGINGITISELHLRSADELCRIQSFRMDSAEITWDFWQLLSQPMQALREVHCAGVEAELDLDRLRWAIISQTSDTSGEDQDAAFSLASWEEQSSQLLAAFNALPADLSLSLDGKVTWLGLLNGSAAVQASWQDGRLSLAEASLQAAPLDLRIDGLVWGPSSGIEELAACELADISLGSWRGNPLGQLRSSIALVDGHLQVEGVLTAAPSSPIGRRALTRSRP